MKRFQILFHELAVACIQFSLIIPSSQSQMSAPQQQPLQVLRTSLEATAPKRYYRACSIISADRAQPVAKESQ